jgi:hypothetical protein
MLKIFFLFGWSQKVDGEGLYFIDGLAVIIWKGVMSLKWKGVSAEI